MVSQPHPWVAARKGRVHLALQAVAAHSEGERGEALVEAGVLSEKHGFDAFFLGDHPAWAPECWLHLALVAARTTRIGLGQMVAAVPYRTPLLTARLQSDLDRLSHGRSILGLGIGWNAAEYGLGANEFDRMGIPYPPTADRQAALAEALAIIQGVWGEIPFTFDGTYYRATAAQVDPPLQPTGPPIVIAGAGRRTLGQVARFANVANFGPGPAGNVDSPPAAQERLTVLDEQCRAAGRSPHDILRSHFTHWLVLAESESAVTAKIDRYFPQGLDAFWGQYLVRGTPLQAAAYYQDYVDAGIEYFVIQTLDPTDEETIALATRDMLPRLTPKSLD